jgi:hypothetical protein
MVIEVDLNATRNRVKRLRRFVESNLLNQQGFVCSLYEQCRNSRRSGDTFREGTMSHVGRNFDLRLDGRPLRIVVVGQESGLPKNPKLAGLVSQVSLDERYLQVHNDAGLARRYYKDAEHLGRNPHMRGTTSALRLVLGQGLGSDHDGEFVQPARGRPFHIFDGFALVNRLLCSAGPVGSSQGRPTRTMIKNCASHFAATMAILQPTLVISQGNKAGRGVDELFPPDQPHGPYLHETHTDYGRVLVCRLSHPSAHGPLRWGDRLDAPYLVDVVAPTLMEASSLI